MSRRKLAGFLITAVVVFLFAALFQWLNPDESPEIFETPTAYPSPQATEPVRPSVVGSALMPIVHTLEPARPKAGIALAHWQRGIPHGLVGVAGDVYYHTWGVVGGRTEMGSKVSVVWCSEKNGYDYLGAFGDYAAAREPLTDVVLWSNEPDRPDQCDDTVDETARLFLDLAAICPDCRFVGPMYSTADDGRKVAAVWERVRELCGSPCPALDSWYGDSLHIYPRPTANYGPSERVDVFCQWVYGGECQRPIWVTEVGWRSCYGDGRDGFAEWLGDLDGDGRVERYFVYSLYLQPADGCRFSPLLDWSSGGLTAVGRAFREAGQ